MKNINSVTNTIAHKYLFFAFIVIVVLTSCSKSSSFTSPDDLGEKMFNAIKTGDEEDFVNLFVSLNELKEVHMENVGTNNKKSILDKLNNTSSDAYKNILIKSYLQYRNEYNEEQLSKMKVKNVEVEPRRFDKSDYDNGREDPNCDEFGNLTITIEYLNDEILFEYGYIKINNKYKALNYFWWH